MLRLNSASLPVLEQMESRMLLDGLPGPDLVAVMNSTVIPSTVVPGEGGTIRVQVTNQGDETAVSLPGTRVTGRIYFSADTSLDQNTDVLLGEYSAAMNLRAGASATVNIRVDVPTDTATGQYHLILQLDTDGLLTVPESNIVNNVVATDDSKEVAWKFGSFAGRTNVLLTLAGAAAGSEVTFRMAGAGYGSVVETVADVPAGRVGYDVTVRNSLTSSSVTVTAAATAGVVLGSVDVDQASLKSFVARGLALVGDLTVDGTLASLTVGDVGTYLGDDVSIDIGSTLGTRATFTAALGRVANVQMDCDIPIKALTMVDWRDSAGVEGATAGDAADRLDAPSIGTLKVNGRTGLRGNFSPDVNLTGAATAKNLKSALITGDVIDADWRIRGVVGTFGVWGSFTDSSFRTTGSISKVILGAAVRSDFLAGIDAQAVRHATTDDDFSPAVIIGTFKVTGWRVASGQVPPRFFVDSNVSAAKVRATFLANMEIDNGGTDFGLFVMDIPGLGEVKSVASSDTHSGWSWTWKPRIEDSFALQDFVVSIL